MAQLGIIGLFVVGLALVVAEIILPGVIIGLVGIGCMSAAIYIAFGQSSAFGWTLLIIALASIPVLVFMWVHWLNRVFAMKSTQAGYSGAQTNLKELVGKEGVAITQLRPSGAVRIDGKKIDVVSESEVIEANTRVVVIEVKSNRVVVRAVHG